MEQILEEYGISIVLVIAGGAILAGMNLLLQVF